MGAKDHGLACHHGFGGVLSAVCQEALADHHDRGVFLPRFEFAGAVVQS